MSEFINTIDVLGDDAVIDSIIQRTITAFRDNSVKKVGHSAFYSCEWLNIVDLPSITTIDSDAFNGCRNLNALILRSDSVATLSNTNALTGTPIASGKGYIYVPNPLVDSYKSATNWSTFSEQIRGIDSSTMLYYVENNLYGVSSSNMVNIVGQSYYTTLTAINGASIEEVIVTMGGIDITADVYNAETGEISIPLVTDDLAITASRGGSGVIKEAAFVLNGYSFVNSGNPTTLNGMELQGFDYTESSGSDGQGNIVTSGKERIVVPPATIANRITFNEGFTIAFKTTITNTAQSQKYMCELVYGSSQFSVIYGYVGKTFELYVDFAPSFRNGSQVVINDNEEHIIAYTHDGSIVRCYLDGVNVKSYSCAFDWNSKRRYGNMYIFGALNMNNCIIAKTADFAIWNKALTADEIEVLFV